MTFQEAINERPCDDPAHDFIAARANVKQGCAWFTYCKTCDRLLTSAWEPPMTDEENRILKLIGQMLEVAMEKFYSKET